MSAPEIRAAACRVVGQLDLVDFLPDLAASARHDDVRPAALQALGRMGFPAVAVLDQLSEDPELPVSVRRAALSTLVEIDDGSARDRLVAALLQPDLRPTALRALRHLRDAGQMRAGEREGFAGLLESECRAGLRYALASAALANGASGSDGRSERVAAELARVRDQAVRRAMDILALGYESDRIKAVEAALLSGVADRQGSALELLEGMLDRLDTALLIPLCETSEPTRLAVHVRDGAALLSDPLGVLRREKDWWVRALALYALSGSDPPGPVLTEEEEEMIPLIEKVMILKGSELFQTFPGEELAGIAALAMDTHLGANEVLFREGEDGDAFYMVVQGAIRISREDTELAILGPREGFGEMAILDHEARSATATAVEPTTLLRIEQHSFDALVDRNPAVARGIYRVLTRRLRSTLAQVTG